MKQLFKRGKISTLSFQMISTTQKTAGLQHQEGEGGEQNKQQLHKLCNGGAGTEKAS